MAPLTDARLRELIRHYAAPLRLYACQWTREPDDVVQESLVDLARADPSPHNEVRWLYASVRHKALNAARAEHRREHHHRRAADGKPEWFLPCDSTLADDTRELLQRLDSLQREIVIARIWGGLKFAEIAQLTGCALTTVHRHYSSALNQLADWLDPNPDDRNAPSNSNDRNPPSRLNHERSEI